MQRNFVKVIIFIYLYTVLHERGEGPGYPHYGRQCGLHQQSPLPGGEDTQQGQQRVESQPSVAQTLRHGAHDTQVGDEVDCEHGLVNTGLGEQLRAGVQADEHTRHPRRGHGQ